MPSPSRQFEHLFHGTAAPLKPGDKVLPADDIGGGSNWADATAEGQRSNEHAFATPAEHHAWYFAQAAAYNGDGYYGERPRVYKVAPHPKMRPGAYHDQIEEYIAPHFKVRERVDTMPGQQGTLTGHGPQPFNWTPFHRNHSPGAANHPSYPLEQTHHERTMDTEALQQGALSKLGHPHVRGQGELFDMERERDPMAPNRRQAFKHDLRHVVAEGLAPAPEVDHKLAEDESMDAFNRRRGRRTNFARRDR